MWIMRAVSIALFGLLTWHHHAVGAIELDELVDEFFAWRLDNSPEFGTKFGINNHDDLLEQYTEETFAQQKIEAEVLLNKTATVKEDDLELQETFSLAILKDLLNNFIDGYTFREYSIYNGVSSMGHPLGVWKSLIDWSKFNTEVDYTNYLARLNALPQQLTQKEVLMQKAIDKGTTQPIEALAGVVESIQVEVDLAVNESSFYAPFKTIPDSIPEAARLQLQSDGWTAVEDSVKPAWEEHLSFMQNTYVPNVRPGLGASTLPDGPKYYAACLRWHLSVEMTPTEIHDIGLQHVDRISQTMKQIMRADNFNGTLQEYKAHLELDPNNYYTSSEDMLNGYREFIAETHDKLQTILNNVPDMEIRVEAMTNRYGATGRYTEPPLDNSRPGTFIANVFDPDEKPKFNMYALALHEAEPGHHTQTAITVQNDVPDFRRAIEYRKYTAVPFNWLFHTAYSEGWALYAEALGEQMGAYTEKNALFGRYASEIHRAARLVVDTGIHAFEWSHAEAVEYLSNYTTLSRGTVVNEINRYVAVPGQACAYKIGEIKINALKTKAMQELGDKFDLRSFHDQVLLLGNAPLPILEDHIDAWIDGVQPMAAAAAILNAALWVQLASAAMLLLSRQVLFE